MYGAVREQGNALTRRRDEVARAALLGKLIELPEMETKPLPACVVTVRGMEFWSR